MGSMLMTSKPVELMVDRCRLSTVTRMALLCYICWEQVELPLELVARLLESMIMTPLNAAAALRPLLGWIRWEQVELPVELVCRERRQLTSRI